MIRRTAALGALLLLVACGTVDASDERPVTPAPTLPGGPLAETTVPAGGDPTTTLVEQSTTDAPSTTAAATTTLAPTTTAAATMALRPDGIGPLTIGHEAEDALAQLTAALGPPQSDSGWIPAASSPFGVCAGNEVRGVRWGPLQVLFGDEGAPVRHLFSYVYATSVLPAGEQAGPAGGLETTEGIGLGSGIADLQAAYPQLAVTVDVFGPTFLTAPLGGFAGTLSSDGIDGFVTSLVGGQYCGE